MENSEALIRKLKIANKLNERILEIVPAEGLEELARKQLCPHYILINPISKEKIYMFIPSEIYDWLREEYIMKPDILDESYLNYQFLYFNRDAFLANRDGKLNVPEELSKIKKLYELPFDNLVTPSGIYFLCQDSKIVYVGQAVSIGKRIQDHIYQNIKKFNQVFFIAVPSNKLDDIEKACIYYFNPMYNGGKMHNLNKRELSEDENEIIESLLN